MGVFYFEDKELPEYQNTDANKILKIDTDGVFLQWLEDTKELPVNASFTTTAFNNGATTSNGVNMMTLNQNGPSNFNTFTPNFSQILTPSTNTGIDPPGTTYLIFGLGVNPSNGVWVVTSNTEATGETRIYVSGASNTSNYLTSWTQFTNAVINLKNLRSVVYANGIWALCSSETSTRQLYYTTDQTALTGWTQVPNTGMWAVTATTIRMKFLNGQFVIILNASKIRVSTDCITWSEVTVNATSYNLQDIEYSPQLRRYVILTSSAGLLYYSGSSLPTSGSNMFTFVSITNGASNTIAWSPKLGMFLTSPLNPPRNLINISNDGINWSQYSANGTWGNLARIGQWYNEFGGFFIIILQQTAPQCAISRDGLTWSFVSFSFSGTGNSIAFDSTSKTFMMSGTDVVHFKSVSSLFNSFVDPDTVYNTFNSNTRFRDVIEYETQTITTASGNNHFTTTSFNRPTISFDTTNSNANIYLQGSSFNGRIGTKFRITKTVSTNNGVRIHAYEPVKIVTPLVNMLNFNLQSPITVYDFIPQTYFGSFDLTRVNDDTNGIWTGTWLVDNVNVYPLLSGTHVISDLSVGGSFYSNGLNYGRFTDYVPTAGAIHTFNYNLATHGSHVQINAINSNQTIFINLPSLNVIPFQNRTFMITFDLILDNARVNTTALFAYQSPSVRLSRGKRPAQDYTGELVYEPRCWRLDTPGGGYARADLRGGPISFLVTTNSYYTWYKCISNDDEFFEDVGTVDCKLFSGSYYLDVNNSIIDRTLYKYNEIANAPTGSNVTLNFEELTIADNKFTVYFTMGSNNATGNFIIKNSMASPHVIRLFSGGNLITITSGNSQTEDGQALYRCTYYFNRFSNNTHNWVIYKL